MGNIYKTLHCGECSAHPQVRFNSSLPEHLLSHGEYRLKTAFLVDCANDAVKYQIMWFLSIDWIATYTGGYWLLTEGRCSFAGLMTLYYLWWAAVNSANGQSCCYSCWQSFQCQYITNNSSCLCKFSGSNREVV